MKIIDHRFYYVAFLIFGLGAWIIPNCLFIEVSALYTRTPEMMSISSYILIAIQAANLVLIPYMLFNQNQQLFLLSTVIWCLFILGFVDGVLISFFWDSTIFILGRQRSIMLLILSFIAGIVGSIANIVFFPFAATYPSFCTTTLSTGLGLSGVVAGIFGLLQDSGGINLRFSVSVFFLLGAGVFLFAGAAFLFLLYHPLMSSPNLKIPSELLQYKRMVEKGIEKDMLYETAPLLTISTPRKRRASSVLVEPHEVFHRSRHMIIPFIVQGWLALINYGILVSIIPFVGTQYKNGSEVMKWASVLSMSADPVGRMLTGWLRFSWRSTLCNVGICSFIVVLFVAIAGKLIHPPFSLYEFGGIFVVVGNSLVTFLASYSQTMIYLILKGRINTYHQALTSYPVCPEVNEEIMTQTAYQRAGFSIEVGASLGTIISFSVIQYYSH